MGASDRDYMGSAQPTWGGWWATTSITNQLIVVNAAVFLFLNGALAFGGDWGPAIVDQFTVSYREVYEQWHLWTVVTSAFAHVDLWHLVWNMVLLYILGDVEQYLGRRNTLVLYLYAGVVAGLGHVVFEHAFGSDAAALGASGAISGFVAVALFFFPHRRLLFMFLVPLPLWLLATVWFAGDLLGILHQAPDRIAHAAHLAGALAGLVYYRWDLRLFPGPGLDGLVSNRWSLPAWWPRRLGGRGGFRVLEGGRGRAASTATVAPGPAPPASRVDADTSRRLDELLRKINDDGLDSLSQEEREFLDGASARMRGNET